MQSGMVQGGLQVPSGVYVCVRACMCVSVYVYVAAAAQSWQTVGGSCVVDVWVTRCQTGSRTET